MMDLAHARERMVNVQIAGPDAAAVDRYVRQRDGSGSATEPPFQRFPTWMWRNVEMLDFIDWLRAHNEALDLARRVGFYGLDLYNMSASIAAVLLDARGPQSKAVVWAHNSHIGDARHTEMGTVREELNIGQLCREHFGNSAALMGLGTHTGTVAAASNWDGDMEMKRVRPSHRYSYERLCHDSGVPAFPLDTARDEAVRRRLLEPRLERFIGVIYRPESELTSHYAQASLPQQFDAYLWFDQTTAVTPLGPEHARAGVPDTYPFAL